MDHGRQSALTKIELRELVLTHGLPLVLAKKLALFLVVFSIIVTLTSLIAAVFVLVNAPLELIGFQGQSPLQIIVTLLGIGFGMTVIPGIITYFTLPRIYDRDLRIQSRLPDDGAGSQAVQEVNRKLAALERDLHGWKEQNLIDKHGDVFVSDRIASNVITYGNLDRARVVFAEDVLKDMSLNQLRAILAHETGHIVENDYIVLCMFAEVTKVLNYLHQPFRLLAALIGLVFSLLTRLPLGIFRYLLSGFGFVLRMLLHLVSLPFWLPQKLLFWESHLAEYLADDFGIALSGSASGLITALMQLEDMRLVAGRSGFKRHYDLFATVVAHGRSVETNSAVGDLAQFLGELSSSHPHSVRRWKRMAHLGFQDERIT